MLNHHLHVMKHLGRILARLKVVDATCGACGSINTRRKQLNSSSAMSLVLQPCVSNRRNSLLIRWATSAYFPKACKEKLEALSGNVLIDSYYIQHHILQVGQQEERAWRSMQKQ